ncbi:MAG: methyltransferase domain-containing protein [Thermoplasmataceae archaeon]
MKENSSALDLLDRVIRSESLRENYDSTINGIVDMIRDGMPEDRIRKKSALRLSEMRFLSEIARSRIRCRDKFSRWDHLWLDEYSSRFSTPEVVGELRNDEIGSAEIVDVGCGAGMQSIMLAKSSHVTGIEREPVRSRMARINAEVYGVELKVISMDYTLVEVSRFPGDSIIFSDPVRSPESVSDPGKLVPSPHDILSRFSTITDRFVFDLPPRMKPEFSGLRGMFEFVSIDHTHSRLTYFSEPLYGTGKRCVMLPWKTRYEESGQIHKFSSGTSSPLYVLVPDESVVRSGIITRFEWVPSTWVVSEDDRRLILGSQSLIDDFPGEVYEVTDRVMESELPAIIKQQSVRIIPRFRVKSENYYSSYPYLPGSRNKYAFMDGNKVLLADRIVV